VGVGEKTIASGRFTVRYPSGIVFHGKGRLFFGRIGSQALSAPVLEDGDSVFVLDPRAVVEEGGRRVYEPRRHGLFLAQVWREWLDEHPEWPPPAGPEDHDT
jgi:hypothetical protein